MRSMCAKIRYEVENGARELLRQIGQESLEGFLEDADEELHEKFKESDLKKDYRHHSRRKAVILIGLTQKRNTWHNTGYEI